MYSMHSSRASTKWASPATVWGPIIKYSHSAQAQSWPKQLAWVGGKDLPFGDGCTHGHAACSPAGVSATTKVTHCLPPGPGVAAVMGQVNTVFICEMKTGNK